MYELPTLPMEDTVKTFSCDINSLPGLLISNDSPVIHTLRGGVGDGGCGALFSLSRLYFIIHRH